jgi:MFS family permease
MWSSGFAGKSSTPGQRRQPATNVFRRWTEVLTPFTGALVDRFGERPPIIIGLRLLAAGSAWLALIAEPGLAYAAMIAPLILAGAGTALAMPAAQKAVVGAVAPVEIGTASCTFTTMRWLGGVFGVAIAVAVFATAGGYGSPEQFSDGFVAAMAVSGGLSLAGAIAGIALPSRRRTVEDERTAAPPTPALDPTAHAEHTEPWRAQASRARLARGSYCHEVAGSQEVFLQTTGRERAALGGPRVHSLVSL